MSKTRLKKEFQRLPKEQLVDQISDLYNKNKSVKESSDFYLNPKNKKVLAEKFKKLIRSEFNVEYPECGGRNFAKRAISDFRNFATFNRKITVKQHLLFKFVPLTDGTKTACFVIDMQKKI